jgi:hypothetical protein
MLAKHLMELHDLGVTMLRNSDVKFTPKTPWISPKNSPGENPWEKTMEKHGEFTGKSMGMKHDEAEVAGCFFFFPSIERSHLKMGAHWDLRKKCGDLNTTDLGC